MTIQVLPLSVGAHMGLCGPFTIMTFREPDQPALVYLENVTRESFLEAQREIRQYELAFNRLSRAALPPDESIALVIALAEVR